MAPHDTNLVLAPHQLTVIYRAFDAAWEEIAAHYDIDACCAEAARLHLANMVLMAYRDGVTDPAALKTAAVRGLSLWHDLPLPIGASTGQASNER